MKKSVLTFVRLDHRIIPCLFEFEEQLVNFSVLQLRRSQLNAADKNDLKKKKKKKNRSKRTRQPFADGTLCLFCQVFYFQYTEDFELLVLWAVNNLKVC